MQISALSRLLLTGAAAFTVAVVAWRVTASRELSDHVQLWFGYALPGAVAAIVVVPLSWRRTAWQWWEAMAFFVPYALWFGAEVLFPGRKSLANLVELSALSAILVLFVVVRGLAGNRMTVKHAFAVQVALCVIAALSFLFVPELPE